MAYKLRRRNLRPLCLACAAILGVLCLLYWALTSKRLARDDRRPGTAPVVNPGDPAPVRPAAIRALPRAIYPYSVIRGGAYSTAELVAALRADPMAAAHYAGFDPSQTPTTRGPPRPRPSTFPIAREPASIGRGARCTWRPASRCLPTAYTRRAPVAATAFRPPRQNRRRPRNQTPTWTSASRQPCHRTCSP